MICKDIFDLREFLSFIPTEDQQGAGISLVRVDDVEPGTFHAEELRDRNGKLLCVQLFVHYND